MQGPRAEARCPNGDGWVKLWDSEPPSPCSVVKVLFQSHLLKIGLQNKDVAMETFGIKVVFPKKGKNSSQNFNVLRLQGCLVSIFTVRINSFCRLYAPYK